MKIIVGNWKENPENLEIAEKLLDISKENQNPDFVVTHAVPNIFVGFLAEKKSNIILQNISCFEGGSHTGEISATQAKNLGIKASIIGHSETRLSPNNPRGDEDNQVNLKLKNLLKEGLSAILCVGEFERENSDYKKYIATQIQNSLKDVAKENSEDLEKIIIAYEPIWAIGKNAKRVATNEEITEMMEFIKEKIPVKVLYGGSVDENNAGEIVNLQGVDGLLVGRASCDQTKWEQLLKNLNTKNNMPTNKKQIKDLNITAGARVIIRLDLNVPTNDAGEITNDFRITETLPTIIELQNMGAKVIILAHKEEGSLEVVGNYLNKKIQNFKFINETTPKKLELQNGEVVLLENVRNDKREKSKSVEERDELAQVFASYGDFYVDEAFSAAHRDHASITSIPKFLPSALGPKFINEIEKLTFALHPEHPSFLLIGGAKFDTKLPLIEKFLDLSDKIFVGGALAHSFWKIKNYELGQSLVDDEVVLSEKVLNAEKAGQIILPADVLLNNGLTKNPDQLTREEVIVDFGPKTLDTILEIAKNSKTIVWNGPVDLYEKGFDWGTKELVENFSKILKENPDKKIILGGGDTVTEIDKVKKEDPNISFTHVSTGGGAMIDFLSTGTLPAIVAIK